ncbi:Phosphatidylinositol 3- and 4-kinase [Streptomyces sp. YIM 130001]|uniref:SCO1664 family protein n=1 Tax=Streptomyces sp. YIM 130001 TaxID=2259644 RepID=UPI000E64C683|nr:SCO1664 family protein [Streptomyces sp. YIM 130001]RII18794.1 Phosphatidylinositol 3- and 4-kinase [Streptomyces sp. YIM 130001]
MPASERIPSRRVTGADALELLAHGELTVRGRIREASNAVLLCDVARGDELAECVYKPVAGERPLWDFPDGTLAQREVAAFEVSEATGWGLVPPTVLRDGPYGEGMCQLWVDAVTDEAGDGAGDTDLEQDDDRPPPGAELLALVDADEPGEGWKAVGRAEIGGGRTALLVHADDPRLRRLSVLDAVINNGDRKGGHLLPATDGRLFGIDHGVTFNSEDKLRTLLWGWAGDPLTAEATGVLRSLTEALVEDGALTLRLAPLITADEITALRGRVAALLRDGRHPEPSGEWPPIPWPPV